MCAIGISLDYAVTLFHWPWLKERLIENMIEGAFFALFMYGFLNAREKRLRQRFKELGYFRQIYGGAAPDLDIGSPCSSLPADVNFMAVCGYVC